MAGNYYDGSFFGSGFFGAIDPPTPTPSTSGGGGGTGRSTINWQEQPRRKRHRNQDLFDQLAETLHELVHPTEPEPESVSVAVASRHAIHDTLQRLDALATTRSLQQQVAQARQDVEGYLSRQEQILTDDEEETLWLM